MGKSSPPPPPTPPTAKEISAANIESAKGLTRLQRAMQFGEELTKDGYVREGVPIPEGSTEVFEDVTRTESAPTEMSDGGQYRVTVGADGLISETYHPTWDVHIGQPWQEIKEEYPHFSEDGEQEISITESVSQGFETPSGEIIQPEKYYQIGEDGGRTEVTRDQAIEADFTGRGDTDIARKQWEFEQETSPERTQFLLDQMKQFGPEFTEQARALVERSDPTGFAARELLGQLAQDYTPGELPDAPVLDEMGEYAAKEQVGDRPTLGEVTESPLYGRAGDMDALGRITETPTYLESEYGPSYERAGEMDALARQGAFGGYERQADMEALARAGDMDALARLESFGGLERAGEMSDLERASAMDALERAEAAPRLERLDDIPEIGLDPTSLAGRRFTEQQLLDRAQSGRSGRLMAEEASRLARGRQAASGNIFGGGAVLQEARAVRQAEEAGQRQGLSDLLGFLTSGQTAGDYESRVAQQNLMNRLTGIQQRTGATQAEFGMGQQVLGQRNVAALQERADALGAIGQRNQAEEREYQSALQALQQRNLAATTEYSLEAQQVAQMNDASLRERADALASLAQRNTAQERDFQAAVQALQQRNLAEEGEYNLEAQQLAQANQAQLQERADQLGALGQRNEAEQAEFANLQATLAQVNQAREAQFTTDTQQQEFNTQQQLRERADELGALAQRNQAQEQEYQGLLQGLSQQQGARTAGFAMDVQGADQRNQATQVDFANQQAALAQTNQARQQSFSNAMQRTMSQQQMQQQQMANLQSFSGLAPVSTQFGGLAGAQQAGAANFNPMQYTPTSGMQLLQGQQGLQGSIFGNQANIWGQQAQAAAQPSGFGSLLGTVGGAWAGTKSGADKIGSSRLNPFNWFGG